MKLVTKKKKAIGGLESAVDALIEKCGGPGGKPGPCPKVGGKPAAPKKPTKKKPAKKVAKKKARKKKPKLTIQSANQALQAHGMSIQGANQPSAANGFAASYRVRNNSTGKVNVMSASQISTLVSKPPKKPKAPKKKPVKKKPVKKKPKAPKKKPVKKKVAKKKVGKEEVADQSRGKDKPPKKKLPKFTPGKVTAIVADQKVRTAALDTAKKQGFKPTSKDKWVNEQQAIEHMHHSKAVATVKASKGKKPKSSSAPLHEAQTIAHLGKLKSGLTKSPEMTKAVKSIAKAPQQSRMKTAMKYAANMSISSGFADFKGLSRKAYDHSVKKFVKEPKQKVIESTGRTLKKYMPKESLAARMISAAVKEVYK